MINKIKFAIPALALSLLLSGTAALAAGTTNGANGDNTAPATTMVARKDCVATARTARVDAVKAAADAAKVSKADAKLTLVRVLQLRL